MIVLASANGRVGIDAAWAVLERGGSALDAVEIGTRLVEDDPDERTVGYGGYPNAAGIVELDASIMDGTTRRAGAVCALQDYRGAITVARAVMDRTPHVMLAAEGAALLAAEIGLHAEDLRLPEPPTDLTHHADHAGTVDFIAIDGAGHVASAVSTSGWPAKAPGRVGDSPVIGAGNYCDDRYGAAASTGLGELSMRAGTARMVVAMLASGYSVADACTSAMGDLPEPGVMNIIGVDAIGNHYAVTNKPDGGTYVIRADAMASYEERSRAVVST
ncbi:MAG TPA: isoaspartyl peptidase/L-asparaginase [Acidimicrobiales bacterium]|nr:isoaspartyl peptidase/L-asparaginase [Acidimicrobiales bacterium]